MHVTGSTLTISNVSLYFPTPEMMFIIGPSGVWIWQVHGVDADTDTDSMTDWGENEEAKKREKQEPELKSIDQLGLKMSRS